MTSLERPRSRPVPPWRRSALWRSGALGLWALVLLRSASDGRLDLLLRAAFHPLVAAAGLLLLALAGLQLVVIGPRHVDNYPSKFFEYLAHKKPVLVLGPLENPLKRIVDTFRIGLYVDSRDREGILDALEQLHRDYMIYKQSYQQHAEEIEAYSAHSVAARICNILDCCLLEANKP